MKFLAALSILVATPLLAKGPTVKIVIEGGGLSAPIQITDSKVADFRVWSGPGVFANGIEDTKGFIVDWPNADGFVTDWSEANAVKPPAGLPVYQVSFYSACESEGCRANQPMLVYVVLYAFDPAAGQGYVYLPDHADRLFQFNHAMWHGHGFEGHWLRATRDWDGFARHLIPNPKSPA
ncbi:MAG TPA: hypothetical protein VJN43_20180 [Bryobacteraceae bacterium]|nr:hypothetical protein [Bryobacteraceae bacterium]